MQNRMTLMVVFTSPQTVS